MLSINTHDLLVLISTPVYTGLILFEIFLGHLHHKKWYTLKDTFQDVYLMAINTGIDLLIRGFYVLVLTACWQYRVFKISHPWIYWPLLIVAIDFVFYWLHRLEHSVGLFWAVHITHHSSGQFNFTVGFRSSVLQPLYRFIFFIPLAFCGFNAVDIMIVFSACQIWGILVHTRMIYKMGWLENILVTPSHHRVHHASNPLYLDKNMGMLLIIWDKLFGTFQDELPVLEYQPIRYGLTVKKDLRYPFSVFMHEWKEIMEDMKKSIPLKAKFGYLFGPPGWSHDGSRQTSEQLKHKEQCGER